MADEGKPDVHDIEVGSDWRKPTTSEPVFGERRLVKLVPTPLGAFPAIWTSPSNHRGKNGSSCRHVLLLVEKAPEPRVMGAEVNEDGLRDLPLVPVEW